MEKNKKSLSINAKSFLTSFIIVVCLAIFSYVLTFIIPSGEYIRDESGNIISSSSFKYIDTSFPFWKFILSPILVLGSDGGSTIIMICVFILVIGGVSECLFSEGIIEYLLKKIVNKYYHQRYLLLVLLTLFFMLLSTTAGCFEEIIPLIPILASLCISFGWDNLTGLGMSIIACGVGYASGILNPFGTGVAQRIANIPSFSGIWIRILTFIILYLILVIFLLIHAYRYEKTHPNKNITNNDFIRDVKMDKALNILGIILGSGLVFVICSIFISALQDYTLIVFALCFAIGALCCCLKEGMNKRKFIKVFSKGMIELAPAIIMILVASSIKYILEESMILDSIIKYMIDLLSNSSPYLIILVIYLIVLIFEFFVPSGSAKAFLLLPLILPVANYMNISSNMVVLAYIFGDGLANSYYPTNSGLIIGLGLVDVDYGKYIKFAYKPLILFLLSTCLILLFGISVGYC